MPKWSRTQVRDVDLALYALLCLMRNIKLISFETLERTSVCDTKLLEVEEEE